MQSIFHSKEALVSLVESGVNIPSIDHVLIGQEVSLENISSGVTLYPFSQIRGEKTKIYSDAQIGLYGAATIENCILGSNVVIGQKGTTTLIDCWVGRGSVLGSGEAENAVFLGKETMDNDFTTGVGFRVRKGSLYEEDSSSAQHTDTKMTILFPWATLGSNLNFCDVLLSGGTSPKLGDFSEVGSGTIHFNFTPYGDKATASLLGNVSDGLFLDKERIFIGGNNSLIGPVNASFGAISAAGARVTQSISEGLHFGTSLHGKQHRLFDKNRRLIKSAFLKQTRYIAELTALLFWYDFVRKTIANGKEQIELYQAGRQTVLLNIEERTAQVSRLLKESSQDHLNIAWERIQKRISDYQSLVIQNSLSDAIFQKIQETAQAENYIYTQIIQNLDISTKNTLKTTLQNIVKSIHEDEI